MSLLHAVDVGKTFDHNGAVIAVLGRISLSIERGELVTIVGPSGSGKSTLLHCLSGLDAPTSGSVSVLGRELGSLDADAFARLRRDEIGFVFQSYNLIPALSAWENVALPLRLGKGSFRSDDVDAAIAAVGLTAVAAQRPGQLSGGQQQRVAIARTLAAQPSLLFADEPTGALDSGSGDAVLALLRGFATGSRSVVMVTHDLEAAAAGDRVLVLRDGDVHQELQHPTPEQVLSAVEAARVA